MTATEPAAAETGLTSLELAVLETLVYSDLFDFPLTSREIWRWLPVAARPADVDGALAGERLESLTLRQGPYVTLPGRGEIARTRLQREASSRLLRAQAKRYGAMIGRLPLVRMVAITGSIAADNAEEGADLDYLIVTAPGRVWLVRSMTMALVRFGRLRGVTVCPNYLLSESALALTERDPYTARELLLMAPVRPSPVHARMLELNMWLREHLPNAAPAVPHVATRQSRLRAAAEGVLMTRPFDRLERWVMRRKVAELRRKATGDEAVFDETMCKGHFEGWRERTRQRVADRMRELLAGAP